MIETYGLRRLEDRGILLEAIKGGQVDNVRTLLDAGMNPNRSQNGLRPIWCAARSGKLQIVKLLLDRGVEYDGSSISAIICRGYMEIALLLTKHWNMKEKIEKGTLKSNSDLICLLAAVGNEYLVNRILDSGCDLDRHVSRILNGNPVVFAAAARFGQISILKMLFAYSLLKPERFQIRANIASMMGAIYGNRLSTLRAIYEMRQENLTRTEEQDILRIAVEGNNQEIWTTVLSKKTCRKPSTEIGVSYSVGDGVMNNFK